MAAADSSLALAAALLAGCTSIAADQRTFDGTRWRVTAINGQPTPATGDYHVAFAGGQISGRFGCNGWGGRYRIMQDTIVAREIASTLMGCPEPAMSFESAGLRVLGQPMRLAWASSGRLTLENGAGTIALERSP